MVLDNVKCASECQEFQSCDKFVVTSKQSNKRILEGTQLRAARISCKELIPEQQRNYTVKEPNSEQ